MVKIYRMKFSKNKFLKKGIIEPQLNGADRGNEQHKTGLSRGQALSKGQCTKGPACVFVVGLPHISSICLTQYKFKNDVYSSFLINYLFSSVISPVLATCRSENLHTYRSRL